MATYDPSNRALHTAIERERGRIARDLHDGLAQQLVLVLLKLEYVQRILEEPTAPVPILPQPTSQATLDRSLQCSMKLEKLLQPARAEIERAHEMLYAGLNDLRHCISSLLPAQMEQKSFPAALQELVHGYEHTQCSLSCTLSDLECIPSHLEVPVFRFMQEALNNIHKHAQATRITIHLSIQADVLRAEVSDNGKGFQVEQVLEDCQGRTEHIGLQCMRERISEAGGKWGIESLPGRGTRVWAHFTL